MYRRWMVGGPAGALYGISESGRQGRKLFPASLLNSGRALSLSTARAGLEEQGCFPEKGKRNNMKIRLEEETVTSDEFLQILEVQQKEKEEKKKGKKKAAEQSHEGNWFIK